MAESRARKLPSRLTLPSGSIVELRAASNDTGHGRTASRPPLAKPLFADAMDALSSGRLTSAGGERIEPARLALRDFHVLRAVLARSEVIGEDEIEVTCRNCGAVLRTRPCSALEIAPWVDGEIDDAELDVTLPFGTPVDIADVPLGRVRAARTVTFEDRTVGQAALLFERAARNELTFDAALVEAMGIVALGAEHDRARIADALASCDDDAFHDVASAFLESHYVPRLVAVVFCNACGARNDVDAPYQRELEVRRTPFRNERSRDAGSTPSAGEPGFPTYDAFATRAIDIAQPLLAEIPGDPVELLVEAGTPAVDDGGEPLLGSYVPPHPGDFSAPTRPPSVTVYYQTFHAVWNEEGPFDWEAELLETIEHELEHHVSFLRGDDPMDEQERAEIRDEARRLVGRREASRRELVGFGTSLAEFAARTWPLWLIAVLALLAMLATQRTN